MASGEYDFLEVFTILFKRLASEEIDTMLPAVIEAYDSSKRVASVKPVVNRLYKNGDSQEYPVIPNVPVLMPSGGGAILKLPIKTGDFVILITSKVEMANFMRQGKQVDALDSVKFNISSSIAIGGLFPFNMAPPSSHNEDSIELLYGGSKVSVKANGEIEIGGNNFLSLVNENFKDIFNNHVHSYLIDGVPTLSGKPVFSLGNVAEISDNELTSKTKVN